MLQRGLAHERAMFTRRAVGVQEAIDAAAREAADTQWQAEQLAAQA
jgi:hypothetical protein